MKTPNRIFIWIFLFLTVSTTVYGQGGSLTSSLREAERLLGAKLWQEAINQGGIVVREARNTEDTLALLKGFYVLAQAREGIGDTFEGINNYLKAISLSDKVQNEGLRATLSMQLANAYLDLTAYENALTYFQLADSLLPEGKQKLIVLESVAEVMVQQGNFTSATTYLERAQAIYETQNDQNKLLNCLRKQVNIWKIAGENRKALQKNLELLHIQRQRGQAAEIASVLNNIGYNYGQLAEGQEGAIKRQLLDSALFYFQQAYTFDKYIHPESEATATTLSNIGVMYFNLSNNDQALYHLQEALEIIASEGSPSETARLNNLIGTIYYNLDDFYNADLYCERAVKAVQRSGDPVLRMKCFRRYADVAQQLNNLEKALEFSRRSIAIGDSLQLQQQLKSQRLSEQLRKVERQEKEFRLSQKNEELQALAIRQLQLQKEKQQQENELLRREQQLADVELERQTLEKARVLQALELTRQILEAERGQKVIDSLQQEKQLQELMETSQKEQITNLQNEKKYQALQLEKQNIALQRQAEVRQNLLWFGFLLTVIAALILIGLITAFRSNKHLLKQKAEIQHKSEVLASKNEEIVAQSDRLQKANQQIQQKNTEMNLKNEEIASQRDTLEESLRKLEETHKQLIAAQTQLVNAEKMASLGQLTAGIAHEINNPINFVSSNVNPLRSDLAEIQVLLEKVQRLPQESDLETALKDIHDFMEEIDLDYLLEEVGQLLDGMDEGAARTKAIVAGLRLFSRMDEDSFKKAPLHDGLEATLTILKSKLRDRIKIVRDYGSIPEVECLPGKINQVFMNLITNAIQAMQEGGTLTITTRMLENEEKVKLIFKDTGVGIPPEVQSRIFEPFFTTKDVGEGTGLGLSISYGIIQQHYGTISVKSEEGKGTCFTILLPVLQPV